MKSEKLPEKIAGSDWRVYVRKLKRKKRERKRLITSRLDERKG